MLRCSPIMCQQAGMKAGRWSLFQRSSVPNYVVQVFDFVARVSWFCLRWKCWMKYARGDLSGNLLPRVESRAPDPLCVDYRCMDDLIIWNNGSSCTYAVRVRRYVGNIIRLLIPLRSTIRLRIIVSVCKQVLATADHKYDECTQAVPPYSVCWPPDI